MKRFILLLLLGVTAFAQTPKQPTATEQLREAVKLLESDTPEISMGLSDSPITRKLEKKNLEVIELHKIAAAIDLIKKAIAQMEMEKQKVRVAPALPAP